MMYYKNTFKKIFMASVFITVLFFCTDKVLAADENIPSIQERYAGSIILEDRRFDQLYWYIEPVSQKRYLLKNGEILSVMMRSLATGISNENLAKLPNPEDKQNIDWEMANRLRGHFLLQVDANGQIWYLNPLDNNIYEIANGEAGLKTLETLAIRLTTEDLASIPISEKIPTAIPAMPEVDFSIYWDVWNRLKMNHYKANEVSDVDRFYGSLQGLAESMDDPYTQFFTPQKNEYFQENLEGSIEGIGAIVDSKNGVFVIVSPFEESPAAKAGLKAQDEVLAVDGIDINGFNIEDSIDLIRGPKGTVVKLKVHRPSTGSTFEVNVTRDKIDIPYVEGEILDGNIAYFRLHMFSEDAADEFKKLKNELIDEDTKGVIIDLRNNPGGYTIVAKTLTEYWLELGDTVYYEDWFDQTYRYTSFGVKEIDLPTVILVNEGSASASEIFASALRDNDAAILVGQTTFGKGSGQSIETFSDGSAIKYSIFEWLTADGESVEGVGLTPDYIVSNTEKNDLQLLKAKNLLQ